MIFFLIKTFINGLPCFFDAMLPLKAWHKTGKQTEREGENIGLGIYSTFLLICISLKEPGWGLGLEG